MSGATTLTFLFTDMESSTPLWELHPEAMAEAMVLHDTLVTESIERNGGAVVEHTGDGVFAQFVGGRPLHAAVDIERAMLSHDWPLPEPPRLRVGLHAVTSDDEGRSYFLRPENAFGPAVNRAARVADSAWGGQILVTAPTLDLNPAVEDATVEPLGEHLLKGIEEPLALHSVTVPGLGLGPFPPPRTLSARYLNLPVPESALIGRDAECLEITEQLRRGRLVTIAGAGGMGKTRLAIAAAGSLVDHFRHGIVYVEAAGILTDAALLAAVESASGRRSYDSAAAATQLISFLAGRHLLLVLDNLDDSNSTRSAIAQLLARCERLSILVTARTPLRVADEWVVTLGPVAVDAELFVGAAARRGFRVGTTPEEMAAIERVCRVCGGVPLALELAAASLGPVTLDEIAADFDTGGESEAEGPIALTFDRFWRELGSFEKEVVGALTVFEGPFTPELAEKVASASPFLLNALRERAIIATRGQGARDPGRRFQLHPVFRTQASRRYPAGAFADACDRYLAAIGDELADAGSTIDGPGEAEILQTLAADLPNLHGAWHLMAERRRFDVIGRSLEGLFRFHEVMGWLGQGADLLATALQALDAGSQDGQDGQGEQGQQEHTQLQGRISSRLAVFRWRMGDERAALGGLERSLALAAAAGDAAGAAFARFTLGRIQLENGYYAEAEHSLLAARQSFDSVGAALGSASCDLCLGRVAYQQGDLATAADMAQRAGAAFEAAGDQGSAARAQRELALARLLSGDEEQARLLLLETLARFERLGDRLGWAESMQCLGYAATRAGDDAEAMRCFEQSLAEARSAGCTSHWAADLDNLGLLAIRRGDLDQAAQLLGECVSVAASAGNARTVLDACIGVVEVLAGRLQFDDARVLMSMIVRDPRLDRSDSGPRLLELERRLGPPASGVGEHAIDAVAEVAIESLGR